MRLVAGASERAVDLPEVLVNDDLEVAEQRHLAGNVGGKLNYFERPAIEIKDRVIGRLDPDLFASLADSLELRCLGFAAAQCVPEMSVFGTCAMGRLDEHAVVFATYFRQRVANRVEKTLIGREDRAVEIKLDDRLRLVDRRALSGKIGELLLLRGHVSGEFHHLERFAVASGDRVV